MNKIMLLCMDVDGTLTDGKVYISPEGDCLKAFDIKDGYGIHNLLPEHGIIPVIITGRKSEIVTVRAKELGINEVYQGVCEKMVVLHILTDKYSCTLNDIAYIGDDIPDLECMSMCGIAGCPADAINEIKEISDFVATHSGGGGAVREFIEWLIKYKPDDKPA